MRLNTTNLDMSIKGTEGLNTEFCDIYWLGRERVGNRGDAERFPSKGNKSQEKLLSQKPGKETVISHKKSPKPSSKMSAET